MSNSDVLDLSKGHISREQISDIIGAKPGDIDLYRRAFVHSTVIEQLEYYRKFKLEVIKPYTESYERLEFMGDAVFNMIVTKYIYIKYPDKDEGVLTRLRSKIIRGDTCASFSRKLGLDRYILISVGKVGEINKSILEDVFEALVGAMFEDLGIVQTERFIIGLISSLDFNELLSVDDNYKDILMRYTQKNGYELPVYKMVPLINNKAVKLFTSTISIKKIGGELIEIGEGTGATKQESEQNACKNSICSFSSKDNRSLSLHYISCHKIHMNKIKDIIDRKKT
jgi:ribonuclease-3